MSPDRRLRTLAFGITERAALPNTTAVCGRSTFHSEQRCTEQLCRQARVYTVFPANGTVILRHALPFSQHARARKSTRKTQASKFSHCDCGDDIAHISVRSRLRDHTGRGAPSPSRYTTYNPKTSRLPLISNWSPCQCSSDGTYSSCNQRTAKDFAYISANFDHRGSNDPGSYSVACSHERLRWLSRTGLERYEAEMKRIAAERERRAKDEALQVGGEC